MTDSFAKDSKKLKDQFCSRFLFFCGKKKILIKTLSEELIFEKHREKTSVMEAKWLIFQALLFGLAIADFNDPISPSKDFSTQSCTMSPDSNPDKVIEKNQVIS